MKFDYLITVSFVLIYSIYLLIFLILFRNSDYPGIKLQLFFNYYSIMHSLPRIKS